MEVTYLHKDYVPILRFPFRIGDNSWLFDLEITGLSNSR